MALNQWYVEDDVRVQLQFCENFYLTLQCCGVLKTTKQLII